MVLFSFAHAAWASSLPLPANLQWLTNNDDPVFASPNAKKGGTYRSYTLSFPLTLRSVGPDASGIFANYLRSFSMGLVGMHPQTLRPIPELATHWAFDNDGKTVYFKLDRAAEWPDGTPITADDYLFTLQFMRSKHIVSPWHNEYYRTRIVDIKKYDDYTIAIRGVSARPENEKIFDYALTPVQRDFHKLDKNWVKDFNWRPEPTPGPYSVTKVSKGKYIEFTRNRAWWAQRHRYFKNRFNPDKIRISVIRDQNMAYRYFTRGELDAFELNSSPLWHDTARGTLYETGYIHKLWFYHDTPQNAQGFYLNQDDPLLRDENLRKALAHAMNIDKVIAAVLRGDYLRLNTLHDGYAGYSNTKIKARAFDIKIANAYLRRAGWTDQGSDGIKMKGKRRLTLRVTYGDSKLTERLVIVKEDARKAGIELNLQLMDWAASFKQALEKKHQIVMLSWSPDLIAPRYWDYFHSEHAHKPQTQNVTNTDDPVLDTLITTYRNMEEKSRRMSLAKEIEQRIHDQAVFIPTVKWPFNREAHWRWIKYPGFVGKRRTAAVIEPSYRSDWAFWIDEAEKEQTSVAKKAGKKFPAATVINTTYKTP